MSNCLLNDQHLSPREVEEEPGGLHDVPMWLLGFLLFDVWHRVEHVVLKAKWGR